MSDMPTLGSLDVMNRTDIPLILLFRTYTPKDRHGMVSLPLLRCPPQDEPCFPGAEMFYKTSLGFMPIQIKKQVADLDVCAVPKSDDCVGIEGETVESTDPDERSPEEAE